MEQVSERSCGCIEFQQEKKSLFSMKTFVSEKCQNLYHGILKASEHLLHNHHVLSETQI